VNRKGIAIHFIVLLVVALFVLVILGFIFAPKAYGNIENIFSNIVPGFGNTTKEYQGSEILRYNLLNGKLEYYDGVKGATIEGEIIVNEKRVFGEQTIGEIERFYYARELPFKIAGEKPEERIISLSDTEQLRNIYINNFYKILPEEYKPDMENRMGVVEGKLGKLAKINAKSIWVEERFLVSQNGEYFFFSSYNLFDPFNPSNSKFVKIIVKLKVLDENKIELIRRVENWKNSILEQPIALTYYGKEDKDRESPVTRRFDINKVDDFLVVDLDKPLN